MPPTHSYLLLNDLRFHYIDWGGDGQPLVLLHGLASNARIWDLVAPRLAARGFRVLALDQRNHGLSDPADDGFDFPVITRDLHAFIEVLGLTRPLLVGHSWGANTVLIYAAQRPTVPTGIILVDGGIMELSAEPGMTWEKAEVMLRPPDIDGVPAQEFFARARGWLGELYSDEVVQIILANFWLDEDERIHRRLPIPKHMQIARAIYEMKTSDYYARLRCPALLCPAVQSPGDENAARSLERKRAIIAQAQQDNPHVLVHWFADTIHDIPLHRPAELAEAISNFAQRI
jgi:pimeloyl-ACP methyl ester carboxylesterase